MQARGSVLNADFADRKSPIAYGYDERLAVYFNQTPMLQAAAFNLGGGGGGGQGAAARSSGRGSESAPAVLQGPRPDSLIPALPPDPAIAINTPPVDMR